MYSYRDSDKKNPTERIQMKIARSSMRFALIFVSIAVVSVSQAAGQASSIPADRVINPEDL